MRREASYTWGDLADLCEATARGSDAFSFIESNRRLGDPIDGLRLERQLVWWLQHARADAFLPEEDLSAFQIMDPMHVEALTTLLDGADANLCDQSALVSYSDINRTLRLRIIHRQRLINHTVEGAYVQCLTQAIMQSEAIAAREAFRPLWSSQSHLVGREQGVTILNLGMAVGRRSARKQVVRVAALLNDSMDYTEHIYQGFASKLSEKLELSEFEPVCQRYIGYAEESNEEKNREILYGIMRQHEGDIDYFFTVGTGVTRSACSILKNKPIIFAGVSHPVWFKLLND